MEEILPYEGVMPHLKNLRAFGYYQLDAKHTKFRRSLQSLYMKLILALIVLFTLQQVTKVYQAQDDLNKVIDTIFLLLTNTDSIYKQFLFWRRHDRIENLLGILRGPLFNQNEPEHRVLLLRTSRQAKLILKGFNIAALFTCLLWTLYPVVLYAQRKPVEFAIWLPYDPNRSPQFYFASFYTWVQNSWLAYANTTMDLFIAYLLAQCTVQLSILRLNLETIVEKSKIEAKTSSKTFPSIYHSRFAKIMAHYNEIVKLCDETMNIFGGATLYLFLIGAWIVCTTAYRIITIDPASMPFLSSIMYLACILIEIYVYCHFGTEVTHESEKLLTSAFALDWQVIPLRYRRSLCIFMERMKRPIVPMAGLFLSLSLSTFISILRSSYSFYAFLKNSD